MEGELMIAQRPIARPRSLAPREHGAYGQLALPLVTALAMGRPGPASTALALAAVLAFVAHEPLLVLAGQRGTRIRREEGARAGRRLAVVAAAAVIAGVAGLALASPEARLAALVPLGLSLLLVPFIARNAEKTAPGELLAAAALSSAALPVALAAGVPAGMAWGAWAAFCLAFGASTFAVRAVVAHARLRLPAARRAVAPLLFAASALLLVRAGVIGLPGALGAAPMLVLALALALAPPRPNALKRVGWTLVAASALLCVALAVGAHL
jgi:hypothetical protein